MTQQDTGFQVPKLEFSGRPEKDLLVDTCSGRPLVNNIHLSDPYITSLVPNTITVENAGSFYFVPG